MAARYESSKQLRGRYVQVVNLLNRLVGKDGWEFTGKQNEEGEYLYGKRGVQVPFPALSDGYRAFLRWLGDLLAQSASEPCSNTFRSKMLS